MLVHVKCMPTLLHTNELRASTHQVVGPQVLLTLALPATLVPRECKAPSMSESLSCIASMAFHTSSRLT